MQSFSPQLHLTSQNYRAINAHCVCERGELVNIMVWPLIGYQLTSRLLLITVMDTVRETLGKQNHTQCLANALGLETYNKQNLNTFWGLWYWFIEQDINM